MSCPNENSLVIVQGDDEVLPLTIEDTAANGTVTPVNLTGATLYLAIAQMGAAALKVDLSQASHTNAAAGISSFTIPRATTAAMSPDAPHTGTLQMQSSGGSITTLAEFTVVVKPALKIIA